MPNFISDVAITELSLVFAQKDGKAYRPVNPEATVIATKAQELPRPTMLGKFAEQLVAKSKSSDAQGEAEVSVAYSTITSVLYTAIDDLWCISYAPDSFSVEARKDAIKTVIDNMLSSIKDASAVVLKAQVDNREPSVAKPPFQAPPGDHPDRPESAPQGLPAGATAVEEADPAPDQSGPVKVEETEGEPIKDESLKSQLDDIAAMVTSQKATIDTLKEKLEKSQSETVAAKDQLDALISSAKEPTPNATAPRSVQESAKKSESEITPPPGTGPLEAAIFTMVSGANTLP